MTLAPELALSRLGKQTASMAATIMGGLGTDGLSKYVRQLAGERVFGDLGEEGYASAWMRRGNEMENPALDYFEFVTDDPVERQVHVDHPTIPYVAATPDGLVRGLYTVEAKSPKFHVWAETREAWQNGKRGLAAVPSEYRHQCRWQSWCCELREGRFVSYHPVGGGKAVIVPYEITDAECEAMAERAELVNRLVNNWVEIFMEKIA